MYELLFVDPSRVFTSQRLAWAVGISFLALIWTTTCFLTEAPIDAPVETRAAVPALVDPCNSPSPIPIVKIELPSMPPPGTREKVDADFRFYDTADDDGSFDPSSPKYQKGSGTIHARGQGSLGFDKKSFAINLGKENPLPLMGMPPSHKWVMIGNWVDTTQLANKLSYDLYAEMGHYGPQSQHVQVCFNEEYWGLYTFGERVNRGVGRVQTKKASEGGFIVKLVDNAASFCSTTQREFQYEYPSIEDATAEQKQVIRDTIDQYETEVMAGGDWRENLDEDAELDYFILADAFANPDSYYNDKNLFYFLNEDEELEPVIWDFIWAFGPPFYTAHGNNPKPTWPQIYAEDPSALLMYGLENNYYYQYNVGYDQFCLMKYYRSDEQNVEEYKARYWHWRAGPLSDQSISERWEAVVEPLNEGVYELDGKRWGWVNRNPPDFTPLQFKEKLLARLALMDAKVAQLTPGRPDDGVLCPLNPPRYSCPRD